MTRVIVHAGLHKTGSSSIQVALKNSTWARDRRLDLPVEGGNHSEEQWLKRFRRLASSSEGVLSDENLLGSPFDGYVKASQRIAALRDAMGGVPVKFVVYIRPQPQWLQSLYLQGIQQGKPESATEFLEKVFHAPNLSWAVLARVIRNGLGAGDVDLRTYRSSDVVTDFFSSQGLGSPPRFSRDGIRVNRSISPIQGPILRELLSDPELNEAERLRLRRVFQVALASGSMTGYSSFTEAQQEQLRHRASQDLAHLMTSGLMSSEALDAYSREVAMLKAQPLLPWAEAPDSSEARWRESLRCIQLLSEVDMVRKSLFTRTLEKLRRDPVGLFYAMKRQLIG